MGMDDLPEIIWTGMDHIGHIYSASGQHHFEVIKQTKETL
jgi:hypothetical protein